MEGFALSAADKASDALLRLPGLKGLVICRGGSRLVLIAGFESAQDSARATRSPTWRVFDALAGRPISQTLDEDRTAEWSPHSILANASSSVCHDDVAAQGDAHPATSITTGTVSSRRHSMLPGSCRIAPFASSLRTGMLCWPLRDHSIRNSVVLMRHWSTRTWGMACTLRYSGIFKTTPAAEFAVSLAFGMGVYHGLIRLVQRRLPITVKDYENLEGSSPFSSTGSDSTAILAGRTTVCLINDRLIAVLADHCIKCAVPSDSRADLRTWCLTPVHLSFSSEVFPSSHPIAQKSHEDCSSVNDLGYKAFTIYSPGIVISAPLLI
eukprot:scaffold18137_cov39-Tisochrysis_lutea.AAC.2